MERTKNSTSYLPLILGGMGLIILSAVTYILQSNSGGSTAGSDPFILAPVELDQPAPELSLFDLEGNQVALTDYLGKVILVNNWATWCPPCREEMPEFQAYFEEHQEESFHILAVEAGQPADEVKAFVDDYGLSFTILLDPEKLSLKTFQNYSLPNSWVIDRKGYLRFAWLGSINRDTLERYVTPLLKE